MKKPETKPAVRMPSLADYLLRYDLTTLLEEAKYDYTQAGLGAPRHLNQKDISARFRRPTPPDAASAEASIPPPPPTPSSDADSHG